MSQSILLSAENFLARRQLQEALRLFTQAEAEGSPADRCASGRWFAHMLAGDFPSAWNESDAIRLRGACDSNRLWLGEDVRNKRVILRCLHGFGDAVQLLRYAPLLQLLASELKVEVPPRMLKIARCFDGVEQVITWGEHAPATPTEWDVQVEVMELPYLFRTRLNDLPITAQYLRLPEAARQGAATAMGRADLLRVGIVWAAGDWNRTRSLPVALLRSLFDLPGCEFWNLQGGCAREDMKSLGWAKHVRNMADCGNGILGLASVISQLDMVISVDTLAAHLAGALGKQVWILLQHTADWRWLVTRNDSPWYPGAKLYRQPHAGDWQGVLRCVQRDLASLVEKAACHVA